MAESPTAAPVEDANFSSHLLAEFLLAQGLVSAEQLEEAKARLATAEAPDAIPMGPAFVPAADGKSLLVIDAKTGATSSTIALFAGDPGDGEVVPNGWSRYSDGNILLLGDMEFGPRSWLSTVGYPRLGLIPTAQGAYLYTGEAPRRDFSPRLHMLPSPWVNPSGASGPIDLFAADRGRLSQ